MRKPVLQLMLALLLPLYAISQPSNSVLSLPGFPSSFHWRNDPVGWNVKDGMLTIKAAEKTDWYIAPTGDQRVASSPLLLFPAPDGFWFSARVTLDFKSAWDAGALVLYVDEEHWLKFAFESPDGRTGSIVSVVTHGLSDDNTGTSISGGSVYLRISKTGQAIFLFYSTDGEKWNLTRAFNIEPQQPLYFGFSAQSPKGSGAAVTFSDIQYQPRALKPWSAN